MKLFWKIFNLLFITVLLSLSKNVQLIQVEASATDAIKNSYQLINQERLMTAEEKIKFDAIKKPDLPEQMSDELKFMQTELEKSYLNAQKDSHPSFPEDIDVKNRFKSLFPEDKREVGVPVQREG